MRRRRARDLEDLLKAVPKLKEASLRFAPLLHNPEAAR